MMQFEIPTILKAAEGMMDNGVMCLPGLNSDEVVINVDDIPLRPASVS